MSDQGDTPQDDRKMPPPTVASKLRKVGEEALEQLALIAASAAQANPISGMIAVEAQGQLNRIKERRLTTFLERLESKISGIESEKLGKDEFVHAFFKAASVSLKTHQQEKIALFADLLAGFAKGDLEAELDDYEMFLSILEDLSPIEFKVLLILDKYERTAPVDAPDSLRRTTQLAEQFWLPFVDEVTAQTGLPMDRLPSTLVRIARTGLYQTWPNSSSKGFEYRGLLVDYDLGRLTPIWDDFIKMIGPQPSADISPEANRCADVNANMQTGSKGGTLYIRLSGELSPAEAKEAINRICGQKHFVLTCWAKPSESGHQESDPYRWTIPLSAHVSRDGARAYLRGFPEVVVIAEDPHDLQR